MRAAVFDTFNGPVEVRGVPSPACPSDGAVVEVKACGVCRSDWHGWNGTDPDIALPHVGGHEFAGVVVEVGPDCSGVSVGDRVTAPFILACGTCPDCASGDPTVCDFQTVVGFTVWGAFAEYLAVPHAQFNLVRVPDSMDFVTAAGMGCRVTTAYRALTDRAQVRPGEWLAIHGAGGVGLSAVMLGKAFGAKVLAIDVNERALAMSEDFGADVVLNVHGVDRVGDAVREATGGGAHVSLDALGVAQTFENSIRGLRKLGRHVQIGMPVGRHANVTLPLLDLVYARQIAILGTRGMAAKRFPDLLRLVDSGEIAPDRLITRRVGLEDVGAELAAMNGFTGAGVAVVDRLAAPKV